MICVEKMGKERKEDKNLIITQAWCHDDPIKILIQLNLRINT